ncbi:MAG: phosphatidylglycerol lysyltransferase domain-containing protein [Synergistaceae bacterium]|nr:phosphatidylglycerol lysyltransferase domain-containing protein [Synergistaceae bacterium]
MELDFQEITLEDAPKYIKHWEMCAQRASDYCFPVIWSLGPDFGTKLAYDERTDLYWLHQSKVGLADLAPVGNWMRDDWPRVLRERYGDCAELYLVPEALADIWRAELAGQAEVEVTDERGTWEYLYDIRALATLAGNKYMKKRNRVNQFKKNYDYSYVPITEELLPDIVDFQYSWCQQNHCGTTMGLMEENHAIQRILQNWRRIPNLCGGAITVGGEIAAYTIGELAGNMLVVHYEKASLEYGAAYQVINRDFLAHMLAEHPELETVNREEDMNDAGLRAAKMSYMPIGFIKECKVKINFI